MIILIFLIFQKNKIKNNKIKKMFFVKFCATFGADTKFDKVYYKL